MDGFENRCRAGSWQEVVQQERVEGEVKWRLEACATERAAAGTDEVPCPSIGSRLAFQSDVTDPMASNGSYIVILRCSYSFTYIGKSRERGM